MTTFSRDAFFDELSMLVQLQDGRPKEAAFDELLAAGGKLKELAGHAGEASMRPVRAARDAASPFLERMQKKVLWPVSDFAEKRVAAPVFGGPAALTEHARQVMPGSSGAMHRALRQESGLAPKSGVMEAFRESRQYDEGIQKLIRGAGDNPYGSLAAVAGAYVPAAMGYPPPMGTGEALMAANMAVGNKIKPPIRDALKLPTRPGVPWKPSQNPEGANALHGLYERGGGLLGSAAPEVDRTERLRKLTGAGAGQG